MNAPDGYEYYDSKASGLFAWLCYRLAELSLMIVLGVSVAIVLKNAGRLQEILTVALLLITPVLIAVLAVGFVLARVREWIAEQDAQSYRVDIQSAFDDILEAIFERDNPHAGGSDDHGQ